MARRSLLSLENWHRVFDVTGGFRRIPMANGRWDSNGAGGSKVSGGFGVEAGAMRSAGCRCWTDWLVRRSTR